MKSQLIESLYERYLRYPHISTDTRNLPTDCLFFALKGDNFNGNQYAEEALKKGAVYAIVDEEEYAVNDRMILVPDVLETLQQLANHHRKQLTIPVIGITGSNGKTTTKELMRETLAKKYNVLATTGNLNNHIGVPLTLLSIKKDHEIAIVEMGANHVGEIKILCGLSEPDYGLITNIGKAHIEGFGSHEGVIRAKKELYDHIMAKEGLLFVNGDDSLLMDLVRNYANKVTYGTGNDHVTGKLVETVPFIEMKWQVQAGTAHQLKTALFGKYNFQNIMAAICIGNHFGVRTEDINQAIAAYRPANNRSQLIQTARNTIYMDAYNANPSSMKMAIESFLEVDSENKMVILGDMLELGNESQAEHLKVIEALKGKPISEIALVGPIFQQVGLSSGFHCFSSTGELCTWLQEQHPDGYHILIKGSRGIRLEKAVEVIS